MNTNRIERFSLSVVSVLVALALAIVWADVAAPQSAFAVSGSTSIDVTRAATGKLTMKAGSSYKLAAKSSAGKLSYKTSNAKVVTVSSKGVLKAKKKGSATITCKAKGAKSAKKVKVTVVAKKKFVKVKKVTASAGKTTLRVGDTVKIATKITPKKASNKNVQYSSSNSRVVSVSSSGKVVAVGPGTASVSVVSCDNKKAKSAVKFTVEKSSENVSKPSTDAGGTNATVSPASDFEYAIGDYLYEGSVQTGSLSDLSSARVYSEGSSTYRETKRVNRGYGVVYTVEKERELISGPGGVNGSSGGGGYSLQNADCGRGVYITGYKGSSASITVPASIDGLPVVYFAIDNDSPDPSDGLAYEIDFSRCANLKAIWLWGHFKSLEFGSINNVRNLHCGRVKCDGSIDVSKMTNLEDFGIWLGSSWAGLSFDTANMRSLAVAGGDGMFIGEAPHLERLALTFCTLNNVDFSAFGTLKELELASTAIGEIDTSQFPELRSLDVSKTQISTLDLASNPKLERLEISNTAISALDISNNSKLVYIGKEGCDLDDATMSALRKWTAQEGCFLYPDDNGHDD